MNDSVWPRRHKVPTGRGLRLTKVDVLWIVIGAVVPITVAITHYVRSPTQEAGLVVTSAVILGAFSILMMRLQAVEREVEDLRGVTTQREAAARDLIASALTGEDMAECRQLLLTYKAVLDFDNPLMTALAAAQIRSLGDFLKLFGQRLPFYPQHELITIEKHYLSFMQRMGRRGEYDACTFVEFWLETKDAVLRNFFHTNQVAAHDGVTIRRIFLISPSHRDDPVTRRVLERHSAISRQKYRNGGSITTRVLIDDTVSREKDDFGIYVLDGKPRAIAVAKFEPETNQLQGNDVSFDEELIRGTRELFEHRWKRADDIRRFLEG